MKQAVTEFVRSQESRFHISLLKDYLSRKGIALKKNIEGRLVDILHQSNLVFSADDEAFLLRSAFFRDGKFLISLTPDEAHSRVLIPGHRFVPFHSHEILPWNCELRLSDNKALPTKRVTRRVNDIIIYHTLFDLKNLPLILSLDGEENIMVFQEDEPRDARVTLTVFDLDEVSSTDFNGGDRLMCTVQDWNAGIFALERLPAEPHEPAAQGRWMEHLEGGFARAFDDLGLPASMEEVIAYAYFYSGKEILRNPHLHIGGFVEQSQFVDFVSFGAETCLWRKGEGAESFAPSWPAPRVPRGDDDSLEAILDDLGFSLSTEDVEAYMRDELFCRRNDLDNVITRCAKGRMVEFHDGEQRNAFYQFVNKLWEQVQEDYNYFSDQTSGKLRSKALEILDQHLGWLREFDQRGLTPQDLPAKEMATVGQTAAQLSELLAALNRVENIPRDEYEKMEEALSLYEQALSEQIDAVEEALQVLPFDSQPHDADRKVIDIRDRLKPRSRSTYVLKVTLKGIRPPIWRRVQVPGSYSLAELHEVLQAAMGWHSCHLHCFTIESVAYGDPEQHSEADYMCCDEAEHTLEDVLPEEKSKFSYTYDFGDDWEHTITIEKTVPTADVAPKDRDRAVCLKGKRACPPEDCGGVWGYRQLMDALADPTHPDHGDSLGQLDDFDAEAFDVEIANRHLGALGNKGWNPPL